MRKGGIDMKKKTLIEALKEGGRVVLIAVVSYLLTEGVVLGLVNATGVQIDLATKTIAVGLLTTVLKSVDKMLHEQAKNTDNKGYLGQKGLTGF